MLAAVWASVRLSLQSKTHFVLPTSTSSENTFLLLPPSLKAPDVFSLSVFLLLLVIGKQDVKATVHVEYKDLTHPF